MWWCPQPRRLRTSVLGRCRRGPPGLAGAVRLGGRVGWAGSVAVVVVPATLLATNPRLAGLPRTASGRVGRFTSRHLVGDLPGPGWEFRADLGREARKVVVA